MMWYLGTCAARSRQSRQQRCSLPSQWEQAVPTTLISHSSLTDSLTDGASMCLDDADMAASSSSSRRRRHARWPSVKFG